MQTTPHNFDVWPISPQPMTEPGMYRVTDYRDGQVLVENVRPSLAFRMAAKANARIHAAK